MYKRGRTQYRSTSASRSRSRSSSTQRGSAGNGAGNVGTNQSTYTVRRQRMTTRVPKARNLPRIVAGLIPPLKWTPLEQTTNFTVTNGLNAGATPNVPFLLNGLARGTTQYTRVGNAVKFTGMQLRGYFLNTTVNPIRLIVVCEKETAGTALVVNGPGPSLFNGSTANAVLSTNMFYNNATSDFKTEFQVLYDKVFAANSSGGQLSCVDEKIWFNVETRYNNNTNGDITDIKSNSMYLVLISDTVSITFSFNYKLWYSDL